MMQTKIGVIVPAFNVETAIPKVLQGFAPSTLARLNEVLVIDNASTDATHAVVKKIATGQEKIAEKLTLIRHQENYGYGESQKTGFQYFIERGMSHVMIIHGDNQGAGEVIAANFLRAYDEDPSVDVVIASRFTKESDTRDYSLARKIGNHVFNFLTRLATGLKMSDSGTGIIFIKTDVLRTLPFRSFASTWQFHPEMNILIYSRRNLKIKEIPLHWADSEALPSIKLFRYALKLAQILLRYSMLKNIFRCTPEQIFSEPSPAGKTFQIFSERAQ